MPSAGQTWRNYIFIGSQRIAVREYTTAASSVYFLFGDHLGSTALTTEAQGNKVSELRYTAFGELRYTWGSPPTRYRYTGQYSYTDEFGLYFYNARWYDPAVGRFTQPDTLVPEASNSLAFDRYAYVYNNPLRYTDPSGHCPWCIPVALGVLKLVDYGWTAWDVYQSGRTLSDPNSSDLDRRLAELNIILALSLEGGEPDDILPVSLPADDLTRRGLIRTAREALAAGDEAALNNLPNWLRPMVQGMVTEERMLAQLGRQGQKRLLEVRLGEEVVKTLPDYLDDKVIGEIKDVAYLSAEKQIRAQIKYAAEHGLVYELHIRPDTKLSESLLRLLSQYGFKPIRDVITH